MRIRSEKWMFPGANGLKLAGRLDLPEGTPKAHALFSHCFTCSKDVFAASRIAAALTERGFAVLRFDFSGLGASEGDFANSNFSSNTQDLVAAAHYMAQQGRRPDIMIGHSLGGAATLAAAGLVESCRAVVTVGAPAGPEHVLHLFGDSLDEINRKGSAKVTIAGREFEVKKQFVEDVSHVSLSKKIGTLRKPLLVMHSPVDNTVNVDNAAMIFGYAKHPKTFCSLDDADHLLSRKADAVYVADVLASWSSRYLKSRQEAVLPPKPKGDFVSVSETGDGPFAQAILAGGHPLWADEPPNFGGHDTGPSPYQLVSAGLGACTAMTLRMVADRKKWPLEKVSVNIAHQKIHAQDCQDCESTQTAKIDQFSRSITLKGNLSKEQKQALLEIADKCPVHRTLQQEVQVKTALTT